MIERRLSLPRLASILLAACAAPPSVESGFSDAGISDTALADTAGVPPLDAPVTTPAWSPSDVAAAWNSAVSLGWPDAGRANAVYLEIMTHGDAVCPGGLLQLDGSALLGCTAASDYYYSGISVYVSEGEVVDGVGGVLAGLHGDLRLVTPAGVQYWVGGSAFQRWSLRGREAYLTEYFEGTWVWEGDDGPLRGGVSGLAQTTVAWRDTGNTVQVDGALAFEGVAFEAAALRVDAEGCSTGTLAIRDPAIGWHTMVFASCDGCATVTHDTGTFGDACFDLSPLFAVAADRVAPL